MTKPPRPHHHQPPPPQHKPPRAHHHPPPPPPPPPSQQHFPPNNHHPPPPHHPHPHPPPPHHPHPHPHPHPPPKQPKPRRTTLASCIVATIFLIFLIILLFILYFSLFKPKDPNITITAVDIPTFTLSPNATAISFTFSQYAAVRNPNRATFHHFDSSLQLLYAGNQVAFMFIPAGNISAGSTVYMSATFTVQSFPIMSGNGNVPAMELPEVSDGFDRVQPTMEMEVRMEIVGRLRVLWFFTHHVQSRTDCRLLVAINDGSVLGFHC